MTQTIAEAQKEIVEEFAFFDDWEQRFEHLIDLGKSHLDIPDEYKTEAYRVRGCQSTVWLHPELKDGRVVFQATSDAMIVRGLIALLLKVYSGRTPEEIASTPPKFVDELGLNEHLTQGRANGLASMIEQIKLYAVAFGQLEKSHFGNGKEQGT